LVTSTGSTEQPKAKRLPALYWPSGRGARRPDGQWMLLFFRCPKSGHLASVFFFNKNKNKLAILRLEIYFRGGRCGQWTARPPNRKRVHACGQNSTAPVARGASLAPSGGWPHPTSRLVSLDPPAVTSVSSFGRAKGRLKSWHGIQCGGHCRALALLLRRSHQSPSAQVECATGRTAPPRSLLRCRVGGFGP
jgi:hypothetical protein